MAKLGKFDQDPDLIKGLVDSGSFGKGFRDLATENTASLGLKTTAIKISSSLNEILDEDDVISPLQTSLQYITAKIFETRDNTSLSFFSGSQAFSIANANKSQITTANSNITSLQNASSSFSTRVTANDAKVSMVIGTAANQAKAGNTTTISTAQANAITANTAKVSSPFPAVRTTQDKGTITITSLQHTPAASDDLKDTLAITVQIVVGKTKTVKTFTLNAD